MTVDRVSSDISELALLRRRVGELERIVAEQERVTNYTPFFDHALDMLCIAGFDGYFKQVNPSWERILGHTTEELLTRPFIDFVHPDDRDMTTVEATKLAGGDYMTVSFKNRYLSKDGSYRWLLWSATGSSAQGLIYAIARDVTAQQQLEHELRASEEMYRTLARNFPNGVIALFDRDLRYELVDGLGLSEAGMSKEAFEGKTFWETCPPPLRPTMEPMFRNALLGQGGMVEYPIGDQFWVQYIVPRKDASGAIIGGLMMIQNITERKHAEQAMRQAIMQEETIRAQAAALAELSTPLIPLNEHTVVMPLIGSLDTRRTQQVIETLLHGVSERKANVAIIDITGVALVDTQVANALVRAADAVKLLGAKAILTGIRPEVAQTLVGLGVNLGGLVTLGSLQAGIAYAIGR